MRPIAPRTGAPEHTYAEEQPEYLPITIAIHTIDVEKRHLLWRFTFTPEERKAIAKGEDIYIAQLNFGGPMTPLSFSVGSGWWGKDGKKYNTR